MFKSAENKCKILQNFSSRLKAGDKDERDQLRPSY